MFSIFKTAFNISNKNIILATPLILFLIIFSIYLGVANLITHSPIAGILFIITILAMLSAFFAGWFKMIRVSISNYKTATKEEVERPFKILSEFVKGVGEYFISFVGYILMNILLIVGLFLLDLTIGKHFIGTFEITTDTIKQISQSTVAMTEYFKTLSTEQLVIINKWNLLFIVSFGLYSILTFLWIPTIIEIKNPFKSLFNGILLTFKNPKTILIFLLVTLLHLLVSFINGVFASYAFLYFLSTLLYFYFVVYILVLIFLYYDEITTQPKAESHSDSGSDSFGQE